MNSKTKQFAKDSKRQVAARKGGKKSMNKLKEGILNEATNDSSRDASNVSNYGTNFTASTATSALDAITHLVMTISMMRVGFLCYS